MSRVCYVREVDRSRKAPFVLGVLTAIFFYFLITAPVETADVVQWAAGSLHTLVTAF